MQLHVSLCGTTVVGSSLENSALSGKLELKLRSLPRDHLLILSVAGRAPLLHVCIPETNSVSTGHTGFYSCCFLAPVGKRDVCCLRTSTSPCPGYLPAPH